MRQPVAQALHTCVVCGKLSYRSRKVARKVANQRHPDSRLSAYPCPENGAYWHIGHLPANVRHGVVDRAGYRDALSRRPR